MRAIFLAIICTLFATLAEAKSTNAKLGVCDVLNNDAADDACAMQKALAGSSLFSQLLPFFEPLGALHVHYANIDVGGAQQLAPNRVASKPVVSMAFLRGPSSAAGSQMLSSKYSVLCVDFQPGGTTAKAVWLQTDLKVNRSTGVMSSSTAPIIPYKSPDPPHGTGTHEYVFLVLSESGAGLRQFLKGRPDLRSQLSRSFNLKSFLAQSNMSKSVVAGSFFKSTHP